MSAQEIREWVKVSQSAKGDVSVKFTVQDGDLSAHWTVRAYVSSIKSDVKEARAGAYRALTLIREALAELEAENDG